MKFENPRRGRQAIPCEQRPFDLPRFCSPGRQARNLSENDPKILDLKSSSEQIIFRKLSLGAPEAMENVCDISCGKRSDQ